MSGFLLIGPDEITKIEEAVRNARANVIPWAKIKEHIIDEDQDNPTATLTLDQRKPGLMRPATRGVTLGTYDVAISFEEQPVGIMRHLSASSAADGKVPGHHAMQMICEAFGFSAEIAALVGGDVSAKSTRPWRLWVEEYEPGRHAVNVVELA